MKENHELKIELRRIASWIDGILEYKIDDCDLFAGVVACRVLNSHLLFYVRHQEILKKASNRYF